MRIEWICAVFVLVLGAVLPRAVGASCACPSSHPQISYDDADVVVLARPILDLEPEDRLKQPFEAIRSWKSELSGSFAVHKGVWGRCSQLPPMGRLLYLKRDADGDFRTDLCAGSLSEGNPQIDARIQWLDKVSACACPNRDAQGWYDQADAVVFADIVGVREEGDKKFADLRVLLTWKARLSAKISVQTEDGSGCGYPVRQEKPPLRRYLLYLHRNESGQFSTGFCSGNLDPFEYDETSLGEGMVSHVRWLYEREEPKKPKEPD